MNGAGEVAQQRGVADVLRDFAVLLSDEHSVDDILRALGDYCTELLPVDTVGVLLRLPGGGLQVGTANTEMGQIVEQLEADLGEGPCSSSLETGHQILEPDLRFAVERYPRFVPRAIQAGVLSVHGLPLTVRVEQIGALNVLAAEAVELTPAQLQTAQVLADVAIAYVSNRRAIDASTKLTKQLQAALDSRVIIEQAKGIMAERHGLPVNEAFEVMRRYARNRGLKLHDVARDVVGNTLTIDP